MSFQHRRRFISAAASHQRSEQIEVSRVAMVVRRQLGVPAISIHLARGFVDQHATPEP